MSDEHERRTGFFVMIRRQSGRPILMTSGGEDHAWDAVIFETKAEAERTARANSLGAVYGFEVYRW